MSEHVVQQARFEVKARGEPSELKLLQQLEDICQLQLLPALDTCFSEFAGSQSLEIPKLEIDLGQIELDGRIDGLRTSIQRALSDVLADLAPNQPTYLQPSSPERELFHFLRTGTHSWRVSGGLPSLEQALLQTEQGTSSLTPQLLELLQSPATATRLANQLSVAVQSWLCVRTLRDASLSPRTEAALQAVVEAARGEPPSPRVHLEQLWNAIATAVAAATTHEPTLDTRVVERARADPTSHETPEPNYVRDGGLVLLHPFVVDLFGRRGLTRSGEFIELTARERAVYLLGYLAQGDAAPSEAELLIPKLLCGMPFSEALRESPPLSEADRRECSVLIAAAITHWGRLKQTSAEAFRETFLQREGRLEERDEDWLLTVEQRGVDVLLDSLPWSFNTVSLPWMSKPLRVHWT